MKVLVAAFNKETVLERAFSGTVKLHEARRFGDSSTAHVTTEGRPFAPLSAARGNVLGAGAGGEKN